VADPKMLTGKSIFVSRARQESPELCRVLESQGARIIAEPLLRFAPPEDPTAVDEALKHLGEFDWWLMTSRHAVDFAAQRSRAIGSPMKTLAGDVLIGAVGGATANAAHSAGLRVSYAAHQQSGAGLAAELSLMLAGKRVLLLRSNLADSSLPQALAKSGATVTDLIGYYTLPPDEATKAQLISVTWSDVHASVFFSPSAIHNLASSIGPDRMKIVIGGVVSIAIGSTTAEAAREAGFVRSFQSEQPSLESIVAALHDGLAATASPKMTGVNRA
jgi:uroporphyrinogen III methyltransferase / synthase